MKTTPQAMKILTDAGLTWHALAAAETGAAFLDEALHVLPEKDIAALQAAARGGRVALELVCRSKGQSALFNLVLIKRLGTRSILKQWECPRSPALPSVGVPDA